MFAARICNRFWKILSLSRSKKHLKVVNLVAPTLNDFDKMLGSFIDWMLKEVGPDVSLHFSRFHPNYRMPNLPSTQVSTLEKARDMEMGRGLNFVYISNVPNHPGNSTYCPRCKKAIIKQQRFFVGEIAMKHGNCAHGSRPRLMPKTGMLRLRFVIQLLRPIRAAH